MTMGCKSEGQIVRKKIMGCESEGQIVREGDNVA
jgi:hypothetical protein